MLFTWKFISVETIVSSWNNDLYIMIHIPYQGPLPSNSPWIYIYTYFATHFARAWDNQSLPHHSGLYYFPEVCKPSWLPVSNKLLKKTVMKWVSKCLFHKLIWYYRYRSSKCDFDVYTFNFFYIRNSFMFQTIMIQSLQIDI